MGESDTLVQVDSWRAKRERTLSPGYSTCMRCLRPWKYVEGHSTQYTEVRGCFPLCEGCWSDLSVEERLPYYRRLVEEWAADMTHVTPSEREERFRELFDDDWPAIRQAVEAGG